jgi:hypothetical protein
MTGRDNIDDAQATVAALRAEVAAQRELLRDLLRFGDTRKSRDAIRSHLAGAAVPADAHVLPQAIRIAGAKMANTCFNWAQERRFTEHERAMLKRMQEDWDEALLALEAKP